MLILFKYLVLFLHFYSDFLPIMHAYELPVILTSIRLPISDSLASVTATGMYDDVLPVMDFPPDSVISTGIFMPRYEEKAACCISLTILEM